MPSTRPGGIGRTDPLHDLTAPRRPAPPLSSPPPPSRRNGGRRIGPGRPKWLARRSRQRSIGSRPRCRRTGAPPGRAAAPARGYEEVVGKSMLVYQVPLERYFDTYNGQPLWYVALASEKSYLSLHLMRVYGDPAQAQKLN